ncbi:hypothetical protein [Sinorhizobium meliloti]|uniref:TrbH/VirB7-like conjugative transfer protein n=1 Tax=Rhizobium meliloti TaxID=382 RepID=A0A2J0YX11_RHIML|nr:hypothetical protein [Sinorhizobium meliloti]PJR12822.1 hypothetical protein CEJ86_24935 [Sinorhizobium meliloti]
MRIAFAMIVVCAALGGCAGQYEQLAKCSADENPVPALAYGPEQGETAAESAISDVVVDDCGPMRPVNQF